jgi:hypothetical protein
VRKNAVVPRSHDHDVLATVHPDARERDVLRSSQSLKQDGVRLLAATIRHYVIRGFKEDRINFREPHRPDDLHIRRSPFLEASQFASVEYDVLIRFDLIPALNVRSADRLLIARRNQ